MAESWSNKLVIAFITLIVGLLFISNVSSEIQTKTSQLRVNDEAISIPALDVNMTNSTFVVTLSKAPTSWKQYDSDGECYIKSLRLKNQTGNIGYNLTITTDYTFNSNNGTLLFVNGSHAVRRLQNKSGAGANITYGDYSYCGDEFITQSWARSVLNTTSGFFGLSLLLISVGLFYSVAKDSGFF